MKPFSPFERIKDFQQILAAEGMAGAILTYSRDIFYYSGTSRPSTLLITPDSYALLVKDGFESALEESWLDVRCIREGSDITGIRNLFPKTAAKTPALQLGLELDVLPVTAYQRYQSILHGYELINISPFILGQRIVKDEREVELTRQACRILRSGHETVLKVLKEGLREIDLAAEVEAEHRRQLHEGVYFMRMTDFTMSRGPLASGENLVRNSGVVRTISGVGLSPAVPTGPSERVIRKGDLVMIDIPANFRGYHADQSRTYVVGRASAETRELYDGLREVCLGLIPFCREGISCGEIYSTAIDKAKNLGIDEYLLSYGPKKADFVGHGVGLELNEPPFLSKRDKTILKEGFLITLELPLVHPKVGGMKIEETVLVKKDAGEILTEASNYLSEAENSD